MRREAFEVDTIIEAIKNGETSFDFKVQPSAIPTGRPLSLVYQMLGPLTRQDVILDMKDPLRHAIVSAGIGGAMAGDPTKKGWGLVRYWRILKALWTMFRVCALYPEPTKENCDRPNSIILLDMRDWFFEHLQNMRIPMFQGAWNMFINVYEHAQEYADIFDMVIARLAGEYASGKWQKIEKGRPVPYFWREDE